jgi:hypothetical protein
MQPTSEEKVVRPQARTSDPDRERLSRLLRDFELHGAPSLLLHHNRSRGDALAVGDVANAELDQIARS